MRVYIYGMGKGKEYIERCIFDEVEIIAYIDNYKYTEKSFNGIPIIKQDDIKDDFDYILISLMRYDEIVMELKKKVRDVSRIISFFNFKDADNKEYWSVLDSYKWHNELQWKHYTEYFLPLSWNINYEIYAENMLKNHRIPTILPAGEALLKIKEERCSLARIGDGEFEQMRGEERANFQQYNPELSKKLKEVLDSKDDKLIVAIADNYGSLEKYTDEAAREIREYLTPEVRAAHMKLLNLNREYYDAYLSRPYLMYRDKASARDRFDSVRELWDDKDVLIVEGEHTRFGVGNDYIDNARSIKRILCPDQNAYSKYDEILDETEKKGMDRLILITLGPTATVLAYELSKKGYWALDIGQIDTEYEWYKRATKIRCEIPNKTVSEVPRYSEIKADFEAEYLKKYQLEIIAKIG